MLIPNSMGDLDKIVLENKNNLLLLYFGASWCGPCKVLKKNLTNQELMSKYDKLVSIYIDVDNENFSDMCQTYEISSLPTQIITILKDNQLLNIHKLEGFNWEKLINMYENSLKYLIDSDDEHSSSKNEKTSSAKKSSDNSDNKSSSEDNNSSENSNSSEDESSD